MDGFWSKKPPKYIKASIVSETRVSLCRPNWCTVVRSQLSSHCNLYLLCSGDSPASPPEWLGLQACTTTLRLSHKQKELMFFSELTLAPSDQHPTSGEALSEICLPGMRESWRHGSHLTTMEGESL
ncbi:uncharacterized protein LOC128928470 isoform X2 [Callithrix jacchus]